MIRGYCCCFIKSVTVFFYLIFLQPKSNVLRELATNWTMKTLDIEFKRHDRYLNYPMTSICKTDGRSARELRSQVLEGDRAFLPCWSRDLGKKGAKEFYVAGFDEFTNYYLGLTPSERCYYELIHSEFPLKLYFDVDISATKNPESRCFRWVPVHEGVLLVLGRCCCFG